MSDSTSKRKLFLRTKLIPPRPVSEFLSRPRLLDRLAANLSSPVTLIAADAGCGKTTLTSEFLRSIEMESVWFQMDHTDSDPQAFLGYITHGIRGLRPGFGENVLSFLEEAGDDFLQHPERAVDLLLNEIFEAFEQPFILVLDDYHHIGTETDVHKLVDRLLQYSSDILHIIITTRDLPPLAMMKRRSRSSLVVINRDDLLFTDSEVKKLFSETLDVELDDGEIAQYRERTKGWVTALQLIRQVAEQDLYSTEDGAKLDLSEVLQRSEKDIFDYFAEEVFAGESDETKELLLRLSLLDSMPLELCSRVFPEQRCSAELPKLVQKNVFVTSVADGEEDEEYRMHPLFRDFLLRRLRSGIGREAVAKEKMRIAQLFLEHKNWEKAIPYLLDAEEYLKAAEIIAEIGEKLLDEGKITTFNLFAEKIPAEALAAHPRSLLFLAEAKRHQGDFERSAEILNRAIPALKKKKDKTGEAEALYSMASLARREGKIDEAFEKLDAAEKLVNAESETFMKCANTRGLCYAVLGEWSKCEQEFRTSLELAERLSNDTFKRISAHNLAIPTGFRGEFGEALRWLKRMFRDEKNPLPQEAYGYLNVGRMHLYRGEFEEAFKSLSRSLELSQTYNMKPVRGEVFEALGHYYRDTGNFLKAAEYFESARKAYDDAGVNRFRQEVEDEFATYFLMRGDINKARSILETLLKERKKIKYEFGIKRVELGLAEIRLILGESKNLIKDLEKLLKFHRSHNFNFEEARNALLLAKALKSEGQRDAMFGNFQRVLDLTARFDYEYWLTTEIKKDPLFFEDEDIFEKLPVDLRISGEPPETPADSVPAASVRAIKPIADLTVKLLGAVEIYRDQNTPFAPDAWTTRRARDIFGCIASSRDRRVEKDILIDMFWGEDEFEAIEKNFHPTISHIRKALNSKQPVKQNFIVFRDGAYQLNPDFSYSIDTELFEELIKQADKARRENQMDLFREKAEAACEIYRGEFMSGVYDAWVDEQRSFFREQYVRTLCTLAETSYDEGNWHETIEYARAVLKHDPYREDMHRIVMNSLSAQGSKAGVKQQFETLEKLLNTELGVEPAPETIRTFNEALN